MHRCASSCHGDSTRTRAGLDGESPGRRQDPRNCFGQSCGVRLVFIGATARGAGSLRRCIAPPGVCVRARNKGVTDIRLAVREAPVCHGGGYSGYASLAREFGWRYALVARTRRTARSARLAAHNALHNPFMSESWAVPADPEHAPPRLQPVTETPTCCPPPLPLPAPGHV